MKKVIANRADMHFLVETFYNRVFEDPLLAPFFKHIDLAAHLPRMVDFWCFSILDEGSFKGNIFDKHVGLAIDESHFKQWLLIFHQTVDAFFEGEKANQTKQRADVIGYTFASKMKAMHEKGDSPASA